MGAFCVARAGLLLLLACGVCEGSTLFASPGGSGSCASASSSCSLSTAVSSAAPGDTVVLLPGDFLNVAVPIAKSLTVVGAGASTRVHCTGTAFDVLGLGVVVSFSLLSCSGNTDCTCIKATDGPTVKVRLRGSAAESLNVLRSRTATSQTMSTWSTCAQSFGSIKRRLRWR